MATRDEFLPLKQQHVCHNNNATDQFSNLNLNQNHKCLNQSVGQSNSKSLSNNKRFGSQFVDDEKRRTWDNKSSSKNSHSKAFESFKTSDQAKENERKKRWQNDSLNANNTTSSTLSLHIAAYENSLEADNASLEKNEGMKGELINTQKQILINSLLIPFEFPRQQTDSKTDPAVMQFTASQKLLNPNQSDSKSSLSGTSSSVLSAMEEKIGFSIRGAEGITLFKGVTNPQIVYKHDVKDPANDVRSMSYSNNGKYLSFCNSINTFMIDAETGEELICHPLAKPTILLFSPKDNFLVTWEMYCIYGRRTAADGTVKTPNPNINFFSVGERKHLKTIIGKRKEDVPQWTQDEKYMVQIIGSEILAFEDGNIDKSKFKAVINDVSCIAVCPHQKEYLFAAFIPSKNEPSKVELRKINKNMTLVSTAVFTNCDKIQMTWNSNGTALLALATVDVDNTGKSYYGNSFLQLISFNGDKVRINFDKEGSVHDVKWSPTGRHFAACYGFMPAKISVYNILGNVVWNLGECHRNEVHFNTQGNLFITCGFGALTAGKIQIWNFDEQKEINTIEVANTTHLEFSSDGQHFYTATAAPRMRVDNCYRLWKYTGQMLYEYAPKEKYELWKVQWKPLPEAVNFKFNASQLSKDDKSKTGVRMTVANGTVEVHANAIKKVGAYVPPHLRKGDSTQGALQQSSAASVAITNDNEKKIKKIEGNLRDIKKLKDKLDNGENLQPNQLEKIEREAALLADLEKLKTSV